MTTSPLAQAVGDLEEDKAIVLVADKLAKGEKLEQALEQSVDDLDGVFSFLVSTKDGIGFAKDVLVNTRPEFDRYRHLTASLSHKILQQGRKLYG